MHIFTISFPTSLQVLLEVIVPCKLGTGFYLGSLVGGINKIYDPDRFDWITQGSVAVVRGGNKLGCYLREATTADNQACKSDCQPIFLKKQGIYSLYTKL